MRLIAGENFPGAAVRALLLRVIETQGPLEVFFSTVDDHVSRRRPLPGTRKR